MSAEYNDVSIGNFFFDTMQIDLDRDLCFFAELTLTYDARRTRPCPHTGWGMLNRVRLIDMNLVSSCSNLAR